MNIYVSIVGRAGAGKTTLAAALKDLLQCDAVLVGNLIRSVYTPERIVQNDIPGIEIDKLVNQYLQTKNTNLILLDNYPTNSDQLTLWLTTHNLPNIVLYLDISPEDSKIRKLLRGRPDDTIQCVAKREEKFLNETIPIIDFFNRKNIVITLNASKNPRELVEESFRSIRQTFLKVNQSYCDSGILVTQRLSPLAKTPKKASPFSSGYDIFLTESIILQGYKTEVISVAVSLEVPARATAVVYGRSSVISLGILVHSGVIDPGYSESLKIVLSNLLPNPVVLDSKKAVAQIVLFPILAPRVLEAPTVKPGRSGFGSTNG